MPDYLDELTRDLGLNDLGIDANELFAPRRRRRGLGLGAEGPAFPAMSEPELKTAIDTILEKGTNGLQWVGETLDKAGRASRGVIGGAIDLAQGNTPNWGGGLLNLIPFSDTMGLTKPAEQVEGRDILTKLGAPENEQGFHPIDNPKDALWDVAGLATEIATDPLSYVSPLAWTKSGKAALSAERAGRVAAMESTHLLPDVATSLTKGIGPRIAAGDRSLFRMALPDWLPGGLGGAGFDVGAGNATAANLVSKYIDPAFDWLSKTGPVMKLNQLFDHRVDGASSHVIQQSLQHGGADLVKDMMAKWTEPVFTKWDEMNRLGLAGNEHFTRAMRDAAEGLPLSLDQAALDALGPDGLKHAVETGNFMRDQMVGVVKDLNTRGVNLKELEDAIVQYVPRQHHRDGKSGPLDHVLNAFKSAKQFVFKERAAHFKDILGGTNAINDIASGALKHPNGLPIWDLPREDAVPWLEQMFQPAVGGKGANQVTPQMAAEMATQRANDLYTHIHNLDQAAYDVRIAGDGAKKIFNGDVMQDGVLGLAKSAKAASMAEILLQGIGVAGKHYPNGDKPEGWAWVPQALYDAGLSFTEATRKRLPKAQGGGSILDTSMPYRGGQKRAAMYLERAGVPIDPYALASGPNVPRIRNAEGQMKRVKNAVEGLDRVAVPPELYQDMQSFSKLWKSPAELQGLGKAYDAIMHVWKTGQTSIFPSFHTRNALGGLFYHAVSGASDNPLGWVAPFMEARNILKGGEISPEVLARFIDPVTQKPMTTSQLIGELRSQKILKSGGQMTELTGPERARTAMQGHVPSTEQTAAEMLKGGVVDTAKRGYESYLERTAKPGLLNSRPIVAADEALGALADLGRKTGDQIEDTLRVGHYLAQRARGMSPADAASSVRKWYFEFQDLTQFEKNVMRRVFPFYCVPEDSECLTREGWKHYWDISPGDEILTYSIERDCMEWQPCLEVASFDHDQDLMVLENAHNSLRFTPNHRWVVQTPGCTIKRPYGTYPYPPQTKMVAGEDLNTHHSILCAAPLAGGGDSCLTPEQARLLGWMVTDGYVRWRGNCVEAVIYQSPKKFLDEVSQVAGGKPRNPHPDTGVVAVPVLNERAREIEWNLRPENLSWTVCNLSREAAEAMFDAMYKGDGTVFEGRSSDFLAATKPHVRDAFQILCALLGKRAATGDRGVYINRTRRIRVAQANRRMEHFNGKVWCPRTQNGTWVMRQGRFVTITGNTWFRKNTPLVIGELLTNPGGKLAQSVRAINEPRDRDTYIPEWVSQGGAAIPTGKEGRFLTSLGLPFESALNYTVAPTLAKTVQRNAEQAVGAANPLIRAGYTAASSRDPFSGRDIHELYPWPTSNVLVNAMIANSPASRTATTTRRFLDERKSKADNVLDFLTGVKVTDVSGGLENAKELEARKAMQELMRSDPSVSKYLNTFTQSYLDPTIDKKDVPPTVADLLRMQATMTKHSRERGKEKNKKRLTEQQELLTTPR